MNILKVTYIFICALVSLFFLPSKVLAAPVYNDTTGIYTDDFATTPGITTSTGAGVDTTTGVVQLRNASSTYTAPYNTTGFVKTATIRPLRIAKWGTLSIVSTIPAGTSIKVQIIDDSGTVFADTVIANNSTGITSFPVDLSNVSPFAWENGTLGSKIPMIAFKFIFSTTDTSITPSIDSLTLTWSLTQGVLGASAFDSTSPWAATYGDQKATNLSKYANDLVYPAFRWISEKEYNNFWSSEIFLLKDKVFSRSGYDGGYSSVMNRDSGEVISKYPFEGWNSPSVVTADGTLYGGDIGDDIFYAIDTITGKVKWVYNIRGGHGNSSAVIGNDGTIYYLYYDSATTNRTARVYAFNPDSTIKFTKTLTITDTGQTFYASYFTMADDGTIYFTYEAINSADSSRVANAYLIAINPTDGSERWRSAVGYGGDIAVVGTDGTIYVVEDQLSWDGITNYDYKVFAINPDGTSKWIQNIGMDIRNNLVPMLDEDGNYVVFYTKNSDYLTAYIVLNQENGSIIENVPMGTYLDSQVHRFDSNGGLSTAYSVWDSSTGIYHKLLGYFDDSKNKRWETGVAYSYYTDNLDLCVAGGHYGYSFAVPKHDERGWAYYGIQISCSNSSNQSVYAKDSTQTFALAPWSLTSYTNVLFNGALAGDKVDFTVTSSMLETNPVFGGTNQAQIIMDNGDIVPLTYSNLNSAGNSVWIGTYTLPSNTSVGTHTYTVEASQSHLRTDTTTHFESESTESQNTGITATGSFNVKAATVYTSPTITLTQNTKHTEEEITTEVEEEQETVSKKIKFVDRNGAPMVNAIIVIDGEEYLTDTKGEIELTNVDEARTYTARITYKGKTYQEEILGVIESEGEIAIDVAEDTVEKVEEKKINIWIYIVPGVIILFVGGLIILNKKRPI